MVDDIEVVADQVDDSPTRPQAGAIAGRFGPGDDQARQVPALCGIELRRATGRRPGAHSRASLPSVRSFPSPDRAPINPEAIRHYMNGDVTLKQFDRAESSPLQFSRAPLWAHVVPPTGEHSRIGHYLRSYH